MLGPVLQRFTIDPNPSLVIQSIASLQSLSLMYIVAIDIKSMKNGGPARFNQSIVICQFMTGSVTQSQFSIKCLSKFLGLEPSVSAFHTLLLHILWLNHLESLSYEVSPRVFPSSSFHEYDLLWLWTSSSHHAAFCVQAISSVSL